ncbi:SHOCT domain-containing protein [Nocardioides sp.]|jgi:putative membrane protein|uniref:SHOCT domain-containing protein n=1 Tax=Nocardioides sp. TaxID=35761 RepID=UPI001D75FB12|nr:SHOCT domain-containing protein [Nocardioides sp.]MBU1802102.1 SHOCT domain-containing protein [Actinomycetota bacterium]MDE0776174.1 SHOCT domain-containing protein [Nocardioides sp.]
MTSGGATMGLFGLLAMLGVVLLAVVVVRMAIGGVKRSGEGAAAGGAESAMQTLQERYARGDLSTEEYQERKRALGEGG